MTTLAISGPVGLAEVSRWRSEILKGMAVGGPIRIDLANAGPWDLTGLQLIISALATGRIDGQVVRLCRVPRVFLDIVERAGGGGPVPGAIEDRID